GVGALPLRARLAALAVAVGSTAGVVAVVTRLVGPGTVRPCRLPLGRGERVAVAPLPVGGLVLVRLVGVARRSGRDRLVVGRGRAVVVGGGVVRPVVGGSAGPRALLGLVVLGLRRAGRTGAGQLQDQVDDLGLARPRAGLAAHGGGDALQFVSILAFQDRAF